MRLDPKLVRFVRAKLDEQENIAHSMSGALVQANVDRPKPVVHAWLNHSNTVAMLRRVEAGRAILAKCEQDSSPVAEGLLKALALSWRGDEAFDDRWAA